MSDKKQPLKNQTVMPKKEKIKTTEQAPPPQIISQEQAELREATARLKTALKNATQGNLLLLGALSLFGVRATQQLWNKIIPKKQENKNLPCRLENSPHYVRARSNIKESAASAWQDNKRLLWEAGKAGEKAGIYFWESRGQKSLQKTRDFSTSAFWAVMVDAFGLTTDREIKEYSPPPLPFQEEKPPEAIPSSTAQKEKNA